MFPITTPLGHTPVVLLGLLLVASAVWAHDSKDPRHIAMTGLGKDMKAIAAQAGAGAIGADAAAAADRIVGTSDEMLALFPQGSGGAHSRAKPEIWSDWSGFTTSANNFRQAATALRAAVGTGRAGTVEAALKAVGTTCKDCHQRYRTPKKAS